MSHANLKNNSSVQRVIGADLQCIGFEQKSVAAVAALSVPDTACLEVLVQAEGGDIRWRADGTAPTTSIGMLLRDGETMIVSGFKAIAALKFITVGAAGAVNVSYWA